MQFNSFQFLNFFQYPRILSHAVTPPSAESNSFSKQSLFFHSPKLCENFKSWHIFPNAAVRSLLMKTIIIQECLWSLAFKLSSSKGRTLMGSLVVVVEETFRIITFLYSTDFLQTFIGCTALYLYFCILPGFYS